MSANSQPNWRTLNANDTNDEFDLWLSLLEKVDWSRLSANPSVLSVLETKQDKINWSQLSAKPSNNNGNIGNKNANIGNRRHRET